MKKLLCFFILWMVVPIVAQTPDPIEAVFQPLAVSNVRLRLSEDEGIALVFNASPAVCEDLLVDMIIDKLPEHPPFFPPDQITDLYERDLVADLVREAALNILRDEVPHGIAVRIDEFKERDNDGAYIEATIFVERDSQKGIVIGEGGRMIKRLGTEARKSIEEMSGRKVYLRLRVKVRKNWRNDDAALRLFGFRGKGKGL